MLTDEEFPLQVLQSENVEIVVGFEDESSSLSVWL